MSGLEQEKQRLEDAEKHLGGLIAGLKDRIVELSGVCERVTTENFELRGQLKREKTTRRQVQKVAKGYSEQLDNIAKTDGKLWLVPPAGPTAPFLPLTIRKTAIISIANLKGGVGKTTITANLGATLAKLGLHVLMLDLDYQNSLSNLCLSPSEGDQIRRTARYFNGLLETRRRPGQAQSICHSASGRRRCGPASSGTRQ